MRLKTKIKKLASSIGYEINEESYSKWLLSKKEWKSEKISNEFIDLVNKNQINEAPKTDVNQIL